MGFEPTTRSNGALHHRPAISGERAKTRPSLRRFELRPCGRRDLNPRPLPPCESSALPRCTRPLHHRQNGRKQCPAGERSRPHMTRSTTELQAPNPFRRMMLDLTGFEPATSRLWSEVSALFTTGWFWMTGNRRCAHSPLKERWRAEERTYPLTRFPPWRRKRHLHHRQTLKFQMCF